MGDRPRWFRPTAILGGAYLAVMAVALFWMPVWKEWDWYAFQWMSYQHPAAFSDQIVVVSIDDDQGREPPVRPALVRLIDELKRRSVASGPPAAVILDFRFEEKGAPGTNELLAQLAVAKPLRIFAVVDPFLEGPTAPTAAFLDPDRSETAIYERLEGYGHTTFGILDGPRGLAYQQCYHIATGGANLDLWALTLLVHGKRPADCDESQFEALRYGTEAEFLQHAYEAHLKAGKFAFVPLGGQSADIDVAGKYVIVATLKHDKLPNEDRPNPEFLAWALSDRLIPGETIYWSPMTPNSMLALLVFAFAFLTLIAFTALFGVLRRSRLRKARPLLPGLAAGGAVAVSLALFAALEAFLYVARQIQPQISLVAIGVVAAGTFAGLRGRQIVIDEINDPDQQKAEVQDWDVFLSYAHEEWPWVEANVYRPLVEAKLSVFLDQDAIKTGVAWQRKIALAVTHCRSFVPIFSAIYFTRPWCLFELTRGFENWVNSGMADDVLFPIMRGHPDVPSEFRSIQALSVDDRPDLVATTVTRIVARTNGMTSSS